MCRTRFQRARSQTQTTRRGTFCLPWSSVAFLTHRMFSRSFERARSVAVNNVNVRGLCRTHIRRVAGGPVVHIVPAPGAPRRHRRWASNITILPYAVVCEVMLVFSREHMFDWRRLAPPLMKTKCGAMSVHNAVWNFDAVFLLKHK